MLKIKNIIKKVFNIFLLIRIYIKYFFERKNKKFKNINLNKLCKNKHVSFTKNLISNKKTTVDLKLIVPIYNSEKYICDLYNYLDNQVTKYKYEVIMVDDGSIDSTYLLAQKLVCNNKKFKLLHKQNGGISSARNYGLKEALGNYIGFIDADDIIENSYVEKMLNATKKSEIDVVKCGFDEIKNGKIIDLNDYKKITDSNSDIILTQIRGYAWGAIFSRDLFHNICFPENCWYEDMIMKNYILIKSKSLILINDVLYHKISHNLNVSKMMYSSKNYKIIENVYLLESIIDNIKSENIVITNNIFKCYLHESCSVILHRIKDLDINIKYSIFLRLKKILLSAYNEKFDKDLKSKWKLKKNIFFNDKFYTWLLFEKMK